MASGQGHLSSKGRTPQRSLPLGSGFRRNDTRDVIFVVYLIPKTKELDAIVLTHDVEEHKLQQGDVGAVVHCYPEGGFEVEFVTGEGTTAAVLTLSGEDNRPMGNGEILHARE